MPPSRMWAVSARVSTPVIATMPRSSSHESKLPRDRQLCGRVIGARRTQPWAALRAWAATVSMSSSFAPTLPMWGNVNVTICPA